ncbi:MAG: hypothetical protein FJ098_03650 [Deltaproteobacteria bacterium]|nr:hypothetical protein [Deltaproteobacteria bacterium]
MPTRRSCRELTTLLGCLCFWGACSGPGPSALPDADVAADDASPSTETVAADAVPKDSSPACKAGDRFCAEDDLQVCTGGPPRHALDCAAHGWSCMDGACAAPGAETTTEREWRERLVALSAQNALQPLELDSYGGWVNAPSELGTPVTGQYFTVQKLNGRWWFVTPEGHLFLSKGVTDVSFLGANLAEDVHHEALEAKYGSEEAWVAASQQRLQLWGYNSVGPWISASMGQVMPHASIILDAGGHAPRYPGFAVTDFWSEGFEENCAVKVQALAAPHVEDPRLLGYFLDNELAWEPNWATSLTLLQNYMDFPPDAPGRAVAVQFLQDHAESAAEFNTDWGTALGDLADVEGLSSAQLVPTTENADRLTREFAVVAFTRYATTAVAALKAVDPNHLVLGCRFHTYHWDELVIEAGNHFDVISQAYYWDVPPVEDVDRVSALVDRPFLLEEFSFKAEDSGYWNVKNFAPVVPTQKDRALAYEGYVRSWMSRPYAVAYHWYKWFDNPANPDDLLSGDNFGLLTPGDEPYEPLVTLVAEVNRQVELWHASPAGRGP